MYAVRTTTTTSSSSSSSRHGSRSEGISHHVHGYARRESIMHEWCGGDAPWRLRRPQQLTDGGGDGAATATR